MIRITFPRALLISFIGHLVCFFSIVIVVSPVTARRDKFSKISFIGSILDKDTFGYYKQKGRLVHKNVDLRVGTSAGDDKAIYSPSEKNKGTNNYSGIKRPYANSITDVIKEKKDIPSDVSLSLGAMGLANTPQVKSEAANRSIIFKPPTPVISRAFEVGKIPNKGEKFQVKLRFLVSPKGKVVFIEKMKSCGYSDIDLIAIKYIKKWQFAVLDKNKPQKDQEGIMLLELEAQ